MKLIKLQLMNNMNLLNATVDENIVDNKIKFKF